MEFSTVEVAACHAMYLLRSIAIRPNSELKTLSKQLLGSLPLDIALPGLGKLLQPSIMRHSSLLDLMVSYKENEVLCSR